MGGRAGGPARANPGVARYRGFNARQKNTHARFTKVLEEGCLLGGREIWVDTQTGVQYLLHYNGNAAGLTVLVDAEGKPLLYRRTPDAPEF